MPTKTQRILGYLPPTFLSAGPDSVLHTLADTFGKDLMAAENTLAPVMMAHWVDHADRGEEMIGDLGRIGEMYGLCAGDEETVEAYREHLKRYVRTFLEGTVTVQGILRISAEALGLHILDQYRDMDCWWQRPNPRSRILIPRADSAATRIFGAESARVAGSAATPATLTGTVDLSKPVDLTGRHLLRIQVDNNPMMDVDFSQLPDISKATLSEIIDALNAASAQAPIADSAGHFLQLRSPTAGADSQLTLGEGENDAAEALLGLAPRRYLAGTETAASIMGNRDLSEGIDLTNARFLRLRVDQTEVEIDCAKPDSATATLDQIIDSINAAFTPATIATHDGHFLTLTSPTKGADSAVVLLATAAQDARAGLFGDVVQSRFGRAARHIRFTSMRDLGTAVDLSAAPWVKLRINENLAKRINCAGGVPEETKIEEILSTINIALGNQVAGRIGGRITLTPPQTSGVAQLIFEKDGDGDASEAIFGLPSRTIHGEAATPAQMVSLPLEPLNLWAVNRLRLSFDAEAPVDIDLRARVPNPGAATVIDLATAVNAAMGRSLSRVEGNHIVLTSPTSGTTGALTLHPQEDEAERRFVSRAIISDDAPPKILGFSAREAWGSGGSAASILGEKHLGLGLDLSETTYLRLAVDGAPAVDIRVAGPRPRATSIQEIIAAIDAALGRKLSVSHDRGRLRLDSRTAGSASSIAFETPQATDAMGLLGLAPGTYRGTDATKVTFRGIADLSAGIAIASDGAISLAIDGADPVSILFSAGETLEISAIAARINDALGARFANQDGRHLILASKQQGAASAVAFHTPAGDDLTATLFGIQAPRSYSGIDATRAKLVSLPLPDAIDMTERRFLNIKLDNMDAQTLDLAASSTNPGAVFPADVVLAINNALGVTAASLEGHRVALHSVATGTGGRIRLQTHTADDARTALFGESPTVMTGSEALPAVVVGDLDLQRPVDLSERGLIKIRTGVAPARLIDVTGASPRATFLAEIIAAINAVFPDMADATEDSRLRLTSPAKGIDAHLAVEPVRFLEVEEYPPEPTAFPAEGESAAALRHGDDLNLDNKGAADVPATIRIHAPHGAVAPGFANLTSGTHIRLLTYLPSGSSALIEEDREGNVRATITHADGHSSPVPAAAIHTLGRNPLSVPRGRSRWVYLNSRASRFNQARFNHNHFAQEGFADFGIFNLHRFGPSGDIAALFAGAVDADPAVEVRFGWTSHRPGALRVNLPADLHPKFGARFNEARFGKRGDQPESFETVVMEPQTDPDYAATRINAGSTLVTASFSETLALGWRAAPLPLRKTQALTLGEPGQKARLYLAEEGVPGYLLLEARGPGSWGNGIEVQAPKTGPAAFHLRIAYRGGVFENARVKVLGDPPPDAANKLSQCARVGLLQARAAGISVAVTRDRTSQLSRSTT